MGVKSTVELTYDEAVHRYVGLRHKQMERRFKAEAYDKTTRELEDELERLNDLVNGGEGYENYIIIDAWRF